MSTTLEIHNTTNEETFRQMDKFSDLTMFYCCGYVTMPVLEACRQGGLFKLLDRHEFRERTWLVKELKANEGYFTIALEVLECTGWLERKGDAYRLTSKAWNHAGCDVMPLYAITTEQVVHGSHSSVLIEKMDRFFPRGEAEESSAADPACGSIIVPLVAALQEMDAGGFREQVDVLHPSLLQRMTELFAQQGWLAADKTQLTASGKALIEAREITVAASYRPILYGMGDLLFGDPVRVLGEPGNNKQSFTSTSFHQRDLSQEAFFDDLKQEIIEIFNRQPLEKQPRVIVDNNWGCNTLLEEIFLTIRSQTLRGRHLAQMPIVGVARHHQASEEAAQRANKS
jgi:hypothetical protein